MREKGLTAEFVRRWGRWLEEAVEDPEALWTGDVFSPEKLAEMRDRLPPDLYAEFAASLFKPTEVAPKLQNPLALTTEEKKKLSNEILEIAETVAKTVTTQ